MDFNKLSLSDKIIAGTGIVLIIDLLFFPWHSVDTPFGSFTITAIEEENAFLGWLAVILALAVTVVTLLRVFSPDTKLPDLPVSWNLAIFYGAVATAAVVLIKLIAETSYLGFGAFLGILLAAGMAYGGFLKFQEEKKAGTSSATS